jgi:glycosyltransferase involved in cell wall biosynthesis
MRILTVGNLYPPHHLGGYELMWRSWVTHMRANGHEVRVLTTDYAAAEPDRTIPEDPDVHRALRWYWHDHEFPAMTLSERIRLERHNRVELESHLAEFRPDAVSWWAMGGMSMSLIELVRRTGPPSHATVVDDWLLYGMKVDAWQRALRRLRFLAPVAAAVTGAPGPVDLGGVTAWTFVSETIRARALDAGWKLGRTEVAHAGIDLGEFESAPPKEWEGRLLYLGRIDERKGIGVAVRALSQLPEDFSLDVVGAGDHDYLVALHREVRDLGLDGRVDFRTVPRNRVRDAYARADVTLFPVLWEEPWGLVPLESMAVGRPVVATGTGGSGEYLRDGHNCLIYEPRDDPGALAKAVARLAGDPALRDRLRRGGAETASEHDEASFNRAIEHAVERVCS